MYVHVAWMHVACDMCMCVSAYPGHSTQHSARANQYNCTTRIRASQRIWWLTIVIA